MLEPIPEPDTVHPYLQTLAYLGAVPIGQRIREIGQSVVVEQVWAFWSDQTTPPLCLNIRGDYASPDVAIIDSVVNDYQRLASLTPVAVFREASPSPAVLEASIVLHDVSFLVTMSLVWIDNPAEIALLHWGPLHHPWWLSVLDGNGEVIETAEESIRSRIIKYLANAEHMVTIDQMLPKIDAKPDSLRRVLYLLRKSGEVKSRKQRTQSGTVVKWGLSKS